VILRSGLISAEEFTATPALRNYMSPFADRPQIRLFGPIQILQFDIDGRASRANTPSAGKYASVTIAVGRESSRKARALWRRTP